MDAALANLLNLTRQCQQAVQDENPVLLSACLDLRQQAMDQIDAQQTAPGNWTDRQRQTLTAITAIDRQLQPQAQALLEQCRQNLLGIRKQRRIQTYAPDRSQPGHYIDIRE